MQTVVRSVCPKDCPDTCGMLTHVVDGRVVRVVGDPDHPITRGWLCGRFQHYEELIHHPDRLLHPLVRDAKHEPLRRASWHEALGRVADRFGAIAEAEGGQAILPYHYLAHMGVVSSRYGDRLWNRLNTSRVGMEICAMAGAEAVIRVFGQIRGTEPEQLGRTRLYVAWGRNPKATNVHAWQLVRGIRPRIVVDPRRSETAAAADLHVRPYPGTDSLLAIGLARLLIESGAIDDGFLTERTLGFDALREAVLAVPLADVVSATGVSEQTLREFARLYGSIRPGLLHIGVGLQRNTNGGEMVAAISMLAALTGQVGSAGGGVLYANFDWRWNDISHPELRTDAPRFHSMLRLGRDLVEDDRIKAVYVYGSNPAATAPNQSLVRRGLARDDLFLVVHDLFLTDTAQLADVVLPATTFAETLDLHRSYWHDYAQVNAPAIPPVGEARSNYAVFRALAERLGFDEPCFRESAEDVIRDALAGTGLDYDALVAGPVRIGDPARTSFDDGRFPTPSGRLELIAPTFTQPPRGEHPLRLLTPKSRYLQGSQAFNLRRSALATAEPTLQLSTRDAAAAGIADGARVRAWNERGEVELVARIGDDVLPGVAATQMVRWGQNANATTSDEPADMGGNSTFHTNYVSVEPLDR